jgi:hypothetical protein
VRNKLPDGYEDSNRKFLRETANPLSFTRHLERRRMELPSLAHLELLAEVDALLAELSHWADSAPAWPPARNCQALVRRLAERASALRVRLSAPLVVATLGGTGTGKSTLVNALVGAEVTQSGRERPTTRRPTLICRRDLAPETLGIDPQTVHVVHSDAPTLRDLVVIDCPDPDTTEENDSPGSNLDRLRHLLPFCDVLLVTATQQKYRSARVAAELASTAPGARLVFVQTHADTDADIRHDWRQHLADEYATGEIFFVDSLAALADAKAGLQPRGEFARLVDLLTHELSGAAATRIRRANFLDLVDETLALCARKIDDALPRIEQLEMALRAERKRLAARLSQTMREELLASRGPWENRLLGEVISRWGLSPFSLVLRMYQGLGGLISGSAFWRIRTPAQLALWGAYETGRQFRRRQLEKRADTAGQRALSWSWNEAELRTAAITIDGYAAEAGLPRDEARAEVVLREAAAAGEGFVEKAAGELQSLIVRQAQRHVGWFTRLRYEFALLLLLGLLLYRLGRNFFFDSWLAPELGLAPAPAPLLGMDFFVPALFWLMLWCLLLVAAFSSRLRRGLNAEINALAEQWTSGSPAGLFAGLEHQCRRIRHFADERERLHTQVQSLRHKLAQPAPRVGQRVA